MGGGSGGGSQTSTSTAVNYSPEEAARRTQIMDTATQLYASQPGSAPYPGAAPVAPDAATTAANTSLLGQANSGAGGIIPNAQKATNFGLSDIIYGKDPTLDNAITAATRPIVQSYTDPGGYFSQNRSDMIGSNMLGSTRDALANAVLGGRLSTAVGDTASKLAEQSRSDTLNTFTKSLALAPEVAQMGALPAQWQSAVGAQREGVAQANADYAAQQGTWDLNYPWMHLQNLANIVFGGQSPGTTSSSVGTAPRSNPIASAAGLASTAVSLASLFAML